MEMLSPCGCSLLLPLSVSFPQGKKLILASPPSTSVTTDSPSCNGKQICCKTKKILSPALSPAPGRLLQLRDPPSALGSPARPDLHLPARLFLHVITHTLKHGSFEPFVLYNLDIARFGTFLLRTVFVVY